VHVYKRADRVAHSIKLTISDLLSKKVRDPRIGFVTVMEVTVSDDLHLARVFVGLHEGQNAKQVFAGLRAATSYLREQLGRQLALRRVPELTFLPDTETDRVSHLLDLIEQVRQEQAESSEIQSEIQEEGQRRGDPERGENISQDENGERHSQH
jgi:ribosome-binding factor A